MCRCRCRLLRPGRGKKFRRLISNKIYKRRQPQMSESGRKPRFTRRRARTHCPPFCTNPRTNVSAFCSKTPSISSSTASTPLTCATGAVGGFSGVGSDSSFRVRLICSCPMGPPIKAANVLTLLRQLPATSQYAQQTRRIFTTGNNRFNQVLCSLEWFTHGHSMLSSSRIDNDRCPSCCGNHQTELRSEEHTSELQSRFDIVCRLLLDKNHKHTYYYADSYN